MPKSSQKTAGPDQPANQRGKSRFGTSGRPARVVLPQRPPRAVDNEIVSILLGADPAALATQAEGVNSDAPAAPAAVSPALTDEALAPPAARLSNVPNEAEPTSAGNLDVTVGHGQGPAHDHRIVEDTRLTADAMVPVEAPVATLPAPEASAPPPARPRRASSTPSVRRPPEGVTPAVQGLVTRDAVVTSFEEFAERWRHGLRKGQLKICEVLYQKTYAVGRTECVTSFSELGRLSGLKMRQCFNIIAQLEALRFIERSKSESTSNKKDQGSVIRFHLYPVQ